MTREGLRFLLSSRIKVEVKKSKPGLEYSKVRERERKYIRR